MNWLLDVNLITKDTTDAHLVTLAKRHGLKLATLDGALLAKPWSAGIAQNPLPQPTQFQPLTG
jgi:predicted nucleic acid-binding protein